MLSRARALGIRMAYRRLGSRWAEALARNSIWPLPTARKGEAGSLFIPELGVPIPEPNRIALELLQSIRLATDLHQRGGGNWTIEPDSLRLDIDEIQLRVTNHSDINMLHEIFVERVYASGEAGAMLVLDVGANVGASALYFAKHYPAQVRAYELVPSTFAMAQGNLEANRDLSASIELFDFGLGDRDVELEIRCNPAFRPSNSIYSTANEGLTEKVRIRDAAPIVAKAIEDLGDRKLVLKLDAEGSEYGILTRLAAEGLLTRVDLLFLEWHRVPGRDPKDIRALLQGFRWFEREHAEAPVGFITAVRV